MGSQFGRSIPWFISVIVGVVCVWCGRADAVVIDDFSVGSLVVTRTGSSPAAAFQNGLDPSHVLGGARDISVGDSGSAGQSLTIDATTRQLNFTVQTDHGYFDLGYGTMAQPLNVDLAASGSDAFLIEFAGPGGFVTLNWLRVFTSSGEGVLGGGNLGTMSTTLPDGRILMMYPFSSFSGTPNFASIQRVRLEFFRLSPFSGPVLRSFVTVPEPAAMTMVCSTTIGVILLAKRQQRHSNQEQRRLNSK
jgi:hypothetical protein